MKKESRQTTPEENTKKLAELISDISFAMLTTVSEDGSLHSRPMGTQNVEFSGDLWFFTSNHSGKVDAIKKNPHVNVAYADTKAQKYVSIAGRAELIENDEKMKELWHPLLRTWFPKGLNDPEIALLRVHVESAEYWDSPSGTLVQLLGFATAITTGERPKVGEHGRIDLH